MVDTPSLPDQRKYIGPLLKTLYNNIGHFIWYLHVRNYVNPLFYVAIIWGYYPLWNFTSASRLRDFLLKNIMKERYYLLSIICIRVCNFFFSTTPLPPPLTLTPLCPHPRDPRCHKSIHQWRWYLNKIDPSRRHVVFFFVHINSSLKWKTLFAAFCVLRSCFMFIFLDSLRYFKYSQQTILILADCS